MTIIQPNKNNNFLNILLAFLGLSLILGVVWLVILYNRNVDITHNLKKIQNEFREVQTVNTELKDSIFKFFSGQNLENLAQQRQLIKEVKPEYFKVSEKWAFVSQ